MNLVGYKTKGI
uniref:Uncharacterized protein n=1 Tax=Arundo donax TaxID=35708 RepID=A0A0A8YXE7_ARUDO